MWEHSLNTNALTLAIARSPQVVKFQLNHNRMNKTLKISTKKSEWNQIMKNHKKMLLLLEVKWEFLLFFCSFHLRFHFMGE